MREIAAFIRKKIEGGHPVVCAVMVTASGTTARKAGARMAVSQDGASRGSVGGGPVEAAVQEAAFRVFQHAASRILAFDTGGGGQHSGMVCGGQVTILLRYIPPEKESVRLWDQLGRRPEADGPRALITVFAPIPFSGTGPGPKPGKMEEEVHLVFQGTDAGELPHPIDAAGRSRVARLAESARKFHVLDVSGARVLIEPVSDAGRVIIAGAGHVGAATVRFAAQLGFQTLIMDDRPDFLSGKRLPEVDERVLVSDFSECFSGMDIISGDLVVILTRTHAQDAAVLFRALETPAGYIGMIGSRAKREAIFNQLLEKGFSRADIDRVVCPIGLDIGAQTPGELAVSIIAQLIAHRAGKSAR